MYDSKLRASSHRFDTCIGIFLLPYKYINCCIFKLMPITKVDIIMFIQIYLYYFTSFILHTNKLTNSFVALLGCFFNYLKNIISRTNLQLF